MFRFRALPYLKTKDRQVTHPSFLAAFFMLNSNNSRVMTRLVLALAAIRHER